MNEPDWSSNWYTAGWLGPLMVPSAPLKWHALSVEIAPCRLADTYEAISAKITYAPRYLRELVRIMRYGSYPISLGLAAFNGYLRAHITGRDGDLRVRTEAWKDEICWCFWIASENDYIRTVNLSAQHLAAARL